MSPFRPSDEHGRDGADPPTGRSQRRPALPRRRRLVRERRAPLVRPRPTPPSRGALPRLAERPVGRPAPAAPEVRVEARHIVRFDPHQRVQHIGMLSTFVTLAVTGLPQKFPDVAASRWWVELLGGVDNVRTIHHYAAYVMLAVCAYHALYLVFRVAVQGRLDALRMIPTPKDFEDAANMFLYFLGAREEKPKFDRFTYLEKFDYWAVFWGIVMIGGSGIVLLFPVTAAKIFPGLIIPVAHAIHSDEAVLAVGWIFIAHLFYVHLAPRQFPMNTSIFTGRVERERYEEEHPLEYERLLERERRREAAALAAAEGRAALTGHSLPGDGAE